MRLIPVGLLILALSLATLQVSTSAIGLVRATAGHRATVAELLTGAHDPGTGPNATNRGSGVDRAGSNR